MLVEDSCEHESKKKDSESKEVVIEIEKLSPPPPPPPPQIEPVLEQREETTEQDNEADVDKEKGIEKTADSISETEQTACATAEPSLSMRIHIEKCVMSHCSVL
jgi:hypothetical protein